MVKWHFSAYLGFRDIWGILRPKLTHVAMGLFVLCACRNAIFAVLPCNKLIIINSTVEGKHSVCMHYIFASKTNKGRIPSVSLISHVFLLCVFLYLQIFAAKKASPRCVFPVFWVVFGHNLLHWEFKNWYSKKPVPVTKKDISDHIHQLICISLKFYDSGFGC